MELISCQNVTNKQIMFYINLFLTSRFKESEGKLSSSRRPADTRRVVGSNGLDLFYNSTKTIKPFKHKFIRSEPSGLVTLCAPQVGSQSLHSFNQQQFWSYNTKCSFHTAACRQFPLKTSCCESLLSPSSVSVHKRVWSRLTSSKRIPHCSFSSELPSQTCGLECNFVPI